jgi:hypothetical protein
VLMGSNTRDWAPAYRLQQLFWQDWLKPEEGLVSAARDTFAAAHHHVSHSRSNYNACFCTVLSLFFLKSGLCLLPVSVSATVLCIHDAATRVRHGDAFAAAPASHVALPCCCHFVGAVPSWQGSYKKGKPSEPTSDSTVVLDPLPHPDQVLHSVSFSPNYRGSVSLAYGGGAGVVRVHTVSAEVVPTGM